MDNYNYPMGADTPDAPWNQRDPEPITLEVDVVIVLKKTLKIEVSNYDSDPGGIDEDGMSYPATYYIDDYELERCVKEQYVLPNELVSLVKESNIITKETLDECDNWELIEIDVEQC